MGEQWQEVGTMKQGRSSHAVSVVSYKDYKDHVTSCVSTGSPINMQPRSILPQIQGLTLPTLPNSIFHLITEEVKIKLSSPSPVPNLSPKSKSQIQVPNLSPK